MALKVRVQGFGEESMTFTEAYFLTETSAPLHSCWQRWNKLARPDPIPFEVFDDGRFLEHNEKRLRGFADIHRKFTRGVSLEGAYGRWAKLGKPNHVPLEVFRPASTPVTVSLEGYDGRKEPFSKIHQLAGGDLALSTCRTRWRKLGCPDPVPLSVFESTEANGNEEYRALDDTRERPENLPPSPTKWERELYGK